MTTTFIAGAGNWESAANWSGGVVPSNGGNNFNVVVDDNAVVAAQATITDATFIVNNARITAGDVINVSSSTVQATLGIAGTAGVGSINNGGTIQLNGVTGVLSGLLILGGSSIELNGGGTVSMSNGRIFSSSFPPATLTIANNNLVSGNGLIGSNVLDVVNTGVIRAAGGTLRLDPRNSILSFGTLSALSGGTLEITGNGGGTFGSTGLISISSGGTFLNSNSASLTAGNITLNGTWNFQSGTAVVGAISGTGTITQTSGQITSTHFRTAAAAVNSGVLKIQAGGGTVGTSRVSSLTIDDTDSIVDLTTHAIVIDYSGGSPLNTIRGYIESAYFPKIGDHWDGLGLTSTTAGGQTNTGVGYAEASQIFSSFPALFEGQSVDSTTLLARYTLYGDADLNGVTNIADFSRLAANFGQGPASLPDAQQAPRDWVHGDFNFDRAVTISDFALMASNFNLVVSGADLPRVPETQTCLLIAAAFIARRRR